MTLAELANYVCTKSQQVEAEDVSACKLFLSKRYELIYNSYLWKDALTMVDISVDPTTNIDNAAGIVNLPTQVERVVAIRSSTNAIQVRGLEEYFREDWDRFADQSNTNGLVEFAILNPVWFTCRPGTPQWTSIATTAGISTAVGDIVKYVGATLDTIVYDGSNPPNGSVILAGQTGYFEAVSTVTRVRYYTGIPNPTPPDGLTYLLSGFSGGNSVAGSTLVITSDNIDDLAGGASPKTIKVTWRDGQDRYTVTGAMPMTLTPQDGTGFIEVESVFKPVTLGNITFTLQVPFLGQMTHPDGSAATVSKSTLMGTLSQNDLKSPSYQRVRLFGKPTKAITISVLGKKPFIPLDFDNEQPLIRNLDNCLIAFGMGDMLKRARQFGKAQSELQEGAILLSELAKLETMQAASHSTLEPASGFGNSVYRQYKSIWS